MENIYRDMSVSASIPLTIKTAAQQKVLYVALFLTEESQKALLDWASENFGQLYQRVVAKHSTIKFHGGKVVELPENLGQEYQLTITGAADENDMQVITVAHDCPLPETQQSHITVSLGEGRSPKDTNTILGSATAPTVPPPVLMARLGVFLPNGTRLFDLPLEKEDDRIEEASTQLRMFKVSAYDPDSDPDNDGTHDVFEDAFGWIWEMAPGRPHRDDDKPAYILLNGSKRWYRGGRPYREDDSKPVVEMADGSKEWWSRGVPHREGGPASTGPDGREKWYFNGELHREDGPAMTDENGGETWYRKGKLHREDGPAIIKADGTEEWRLYGTLHREDGPALIRTDGTYEWYKNGKLHRDEQDKPARLNAEGYNSYFRDGKQYWPPQFDVMASSTISLFKTSGLKVYLDDERNTPPGWHREYFVEDVINLIEKGDVDEVSLDNDLGEGNTEGYMVVKYLEEKTWTDDDFIPPAINAHTANPVARDEMLAGIRSIEKAISRRNKNANVNLQLFRTAQYVPTKDLPQPLIRALKSIGYNKRDVEFITANEVPVQTNAGFEYSRGITVLVNMMTGTTEQFTGNFGGSNMFEKTVADDSDAMIPLPINAAVIKSTATGFAKVYVGPDTMSAMLSEKSNDLSFRDLQILSTFTQFKSSYRKEEWEKGRVTPEDMSSLVDRGFLKQNKAGSFMITTDGKNAVGDHRFDYYWKEDPTLAKYRGVMKTAITQEELNKRYGDNVEYDEDETTGHGMAFVNGTDGTAKFTMLYGATHSFNDEPAIHILSNTTGEYREWHSHGMKHRKDSPAVIFGSDGSEERREWWDMGNRLNIEEGPSANETIDNWGDESDHD